MFIDSETFHNLNDQVDKMEDNLKYEASCKIPLDVEVSMSSVNETTDNDPSEQKISHSIINKWIDEDLGCLNSGSGDRNNFSQKDIPYEYIVPFHRTESTLLTLPHDQLNVHLTQSNNTSLSIASSGNKFRQVDVKHKGLTSKHQEKRKKITKSIVKKSIHGSNDVKDSRENIEMCEEKIEKTSSQIQETVIPSVSILT